MVDAEVRISVGFASEHRDAAAALYWDAFGRKLEKAIGPRERGIKLIEQGLDPTRAVVALHDGQLVGLAGFQLGDRALTKIEVRDMLESLIAMAKLKTRRARNSKPRRSGLTTTGLMSALRPRAPRICPVAARTS